MSLPAKPDAVIWDMDGTLIDQTTGIIRCYSEVISALGHPAPDPQAIRRSMGGPMADTMALFVRPEGLDTACREFRTRFPGLMFDGIIVLPGARELVHRFHQAGIPQAILTNKHGPTAREVSRYCGFDACIQVCIGNTDTEWSKPDPALTRHVLGSIDALNATGAICIGDSPTDVATARNVDLQCYGVSTGAHSAEELLAAGAAEVASSLGDWLND